jgi:hypothetical protein
VALGTKRHRLKVTEFLSTPAHRIGSGFITGPWISRVTSLLNAAISKKRTRDEHFVTGSEAFLQSDRGIPRTANFYPI